MNNTRIRKSRLAPRGRGVLPAGAVQLGLEQLEDRVLLAADVPFQNPTNRFDVNNDGVFNRLDVFSLIGNLRLGGERPLGSAGAAAEGEGPTSGGTFLDVNGDNIFDRRDIFDSIGHFRGEGEQVPTGNPVMMNYSLRVFSADGLTEFTDPDGAGPLGVTIPQNGNFLIRGFVQDTGATQPLHNPRNPALGGIGTFSLDIGYNDVSNGGAPSTGTITPTAPIPGTGPVRFEGTVGATTPRPYQFPNGVTVESVYTNSGGTPPIDNAAAHRIQAIQGVNRTFPDNGPPPTGFLGLGQVMAFEIPFTAGPTTGTDVFVHTLEFTPQPGQTRIQATQDNANISGVGPDGIPGTSDDVFTNQQIQDVELHLSIVTDTFANPDLVILHEQPDAQPPGSPQPPIKVNVRANDFFPPGKETAIVLNTVLPASIGTASIDDRGTTGVGERSDDLLVFTPANPYLTGLVQIDYTLQVFNNPGDLTPLPNSSTGRLTIDLREFNFAPIVSAPGVDEALLGAALTFDQGTTQIFVAAGANGLLTNDLPGDPLDDSDAIGAFPGEEARPNQNLHIVGDTRVPFNNPPFTPINPAQRPFVVPAEAARSIDVDANGNLRFVSNPAFSGTATIHYFVEDNGLEQSLTPLSPPPAQIVPKRTEQTLVVHINEVPDLAEFKVEFFADAAATMPLNGEVGINQNFFARVTVEQTAAGTAAGGLGVSQAIIDMSFDPAIITASPPNDTSISLPPAPDNLFSGGFAGNLVQPGQNLINNAGGSAVPAAVNDELPHAVFNVQMLSGNLATSTTTRLATLFAKNQPAGGATPDVQIATLAGNRSLLESEIKFNTADLFVALGFRPAAADDGTIGVLPDRYTITEGTTRLDVLNAGNTHGNATAVPFNPAFGVLNNDTDQDAVLNPGTPGSTTDGNQLFANIVDLSGVTHGVLSLRDPSVALDTAPNAFLPVTGPNAVPIPVGFGWKGTFRYEPLTADINGVDTFTYQVEDSDGRKSLTNATVTIEITPAFDAPVANDDNYSVIPPPVLIINQEGNRIGDGNAQTPLETFGVLNNDTDADVNADPNAPASVIPILTAHLLSLPNFGTLTLIDSNGVSHDAASDGDETQITWTGQVPAATWNGLFTFVPTPGVSGIVDEFTYQAIDETGLRSAPATVRIGIDLANITVAGRIVIDDSSPAAGANPYPSTLGPNGRFEFQDVNGSGQFDAGDKLIEQTLGGVEVTLTGTTVAIPGTPSFAITVTTKTDSAGVFRFTEYLDPNTNTLKPIPKGNYQIVEDQRIKIFFFDGVDTLSANSIISRGTAPPIYVHPILSQGGTPIPGSSDDSQAIGHLDRVAIDRGAADVLFTEHGLKSQFIVPTFVSTNRSGVTLGIDANQNIIWYTIDYSMDDGLGWNVFNHQITGVSIANGKATLTFTEPNANPALPDVQVKISVPLSDSQHFSSVSANGVQKIRFIGKAADLKARFQVP